MRRLHCAIAIAAAVLGQVSATARGQTSATPASSIERQLARPVSITWHGEEMGRALERLAASQQLPLWIDRRVDISAPVELVVTQQPVDAALESLLAAHGWAAAPYHGVLYVGPKQAAEELATLSAIAVQSLERAPAANRAGWLKAEEWAFPRLSEPRTLVTELSRDAGASVRNAERVPHDLFSARTLPAMRIIDRVVLVLVGFDLAPKVSADGRQLEVVGIERPVALTESYAVSRQRVAAVKAALGELRDAKPRWSGSRLTLTASAAAHQRVARAIAGDRPQVADRRRPPAPGKSEQRFTLKIDNKPVGPVMEQLAGQLQLTVAWDAAIDAAARARLVSCEVRDADLEQLLTAILTPAGLAYSRDGQSILIEPTPERETPAQR